MFTGIIEEMGIIEALRPKADAIEMQVRAQISGTGVKIGDSISVNGCCLTAEKIRASRAGKLIQFSLLAESWNRTNFRFASVGSKVNLERALRVGDRLGGHFVSGHIDGLGRVEKWHQVGKDYTLDISAPPEIMRYIVFKGSVAIDGISLTVAAVKKTGFQLWIIPHTRTITTLKDRKKGDSINIEVDMIGKYIERFVTAGVEAPSALYAGKSQRRGKR